jgi:Predicted Zn-dependent protease (DUF2268)
MARRSNRRRLLWPAALAAGVIAAAGCSGGQPGAPSRPAAARQPLPAPVTEPIANHRFTVTFSGAALQAAKTAGISLPDLAGQALGHVSALLPGPETTISVSYGRPASLIPKTGMAGYTNPLNGQIMTAFGPVPQVSTRKVLTFWFPRDLAHEVNHSVRILAGPGHGLTLLDDLIDEGIATAFDQAAFPGPPDPRGYALTPSQEGTLWKKTAPQLDSADLDAIWLFGGHFHGYTVPNWTGYDIGYHIVGDCRQHHPDVGWPALTSASAATVLAGSHYQPCPR